MSPHPWYEDVDRLYLIQNAERTSEQDEVDHPVIDSYSQYFTWLSLLARDEIAGGHLNTKIHDQPKQENIRGQDPKYSFALRSKNSGREYTHYQSRQDLWKLRE